MLGEIEFLMTDDFAEFTAAIQEIKKKKEEKAVEIKKLYEQFQQEVAELDQQAKKIYEEWQAKVKEDEPASKKKAKKVDANKT